MGRVLIFLYGMVAYMVFFVTFTYMIGFVGGFVVPKTIDSGIEASLASALTVNLVLIALFAIQHTIMARPGFKKWWTRIIPASAERSTFVLVTSLLLALLFWQWRPMAGVIWEIENIPGRFAMWALFCAGWVLVFLSSFVINHFDLFGLRQVFLHLRGKAYTHLNFKVFSLYRFVRHPLMTGFLLAMWATPRMTVSHLVFTLGMTVYILMGIRFEERDLVRFHGRAYQEYRKKVPMLVPSLRRKGGYVMPEEEQVPSRDLTS